MVDGNFSLKMHQFAYSSGAATPTETSEVFKVGHLDFSNLWCGKYPCSAGLTSLFGK